MNKKLLAFLCACSLTVSLTGCSKKENDSTNISSVVVDESIDLTPTEEIEEVDTYITLSDEEIKIDGEGASVKDNIITISDKGVYSISGELSDGQIIVDSEKKVQLQLNNVTLTSKNSSPINVKNAKKLTLALMDETVNTLSDTENYVFEEDEDEPNATLFSKDDLTIIGTGALNINSNYKHGINTKDDLRIEGGIITVNSVNDGIRGKDSIEIVGGEINVVSKEDGIKSNNSDDATKGYIKIGAGKINIESGEDAIQAETNLIIADGEINILSGEGSENAPVKSDGMGEMSKPSDMGDMTKPEDINLDDLSDEDKAKFEEMKDKMGNMQMPDMGQMNPSDMQDGEMPTMPSGDMINPSDMQNGENSDFNPFDIDNKDFNMDNFNDNNSTNNSSDNEEDDTSRKGLKAGAYLILKGGKFEIDSYDDTIHSNGNIRIDAGDFNLASGDDGVHADLTLEINGSDIVITKSYEGLEGQIVNINDGNINLVASDDGINAAGDDNSITPEMNIKGGYIVVDADGDGIDSNGNITMDNGTLLVNGPSRGGNGALDYDGTFNIDGGTLVAVGTTSMAQAPSKSSTQNFASIALESQNASTIVRVENENGEDIITFAPTKDYQSVIVSTPELVKGKYKVYFGGSFDGEMKDGLAISGTYTSNSEATEFEVDDISTTVGQSTFGGFGGGHKNDMTDEEKQQMKEQMKDKKDKSAGNGNKNNSSNNRNNSSKSNGNSSSKDNGVI